MGDLPRRERVRLRVQRAVSYALAPLWMPLLAAGLRVGGGWRIHERGALRARYRALRRAHPGPLLICPNHLTMIDSALVAWALGSPLDYLRDFAALPWNLPERRHFASRGWRRALVWLLKCVPIERGRRADVGRVLERAAWLLAQGESVLVFPEGGRSRTGRVRTDARTFGPGRLLAAVPDCRVLCVYLRGDAQAGWSALPRRRQRFRVELALLEPRSAADGLRRAVDLTAQVLARLAEMEARHVAAAGTAAAVAPLPGGSVAR